MSVQKTFIRFCFRADNWRLKFGICIPALLSRSCLNPGSLAHPEIISATFEVLSAVSSMVILFSWVDFSGFTGK